MLTFSIISQGYMVQPIHDGLVECGCQVRLQPEVGKWDFRHCDYLLLHGPANPIGNLIRELKRLGDIPPLIIWFSEQVPDLRTPIWRAGLLSRLRYLLDPWYDEKLAPWLQSHSNKKLPVPGIIRWRRVGELLALHATGCLKLVCTFTRTQKEFLERLGLPSWVLPFGYHPHFGQKYDLQRETEVLFLGTTSDVRRKRLFPNLQQAFVREGIELKIVDGSPERGAYYGNERTMLLNRTNILLNVMKQPWDDPIYRLLLATANGCLLLSEPVQESSRWKFVPGIHFASCELDQLAQSARYYLDNATAKQEILNKAEEAILHRSSMTQMAGLLLEHIASLDREKKEH